MVDHHENTDFDPRIRALMRILEELDASGADYALIHGSDNSLPNVTSDVDIACGSPPPQLIEPVLERLHDLGELKIVNRLHYEVPHGYYYIIAVPSAEHLFLHLDCLYDPIGINRYHLPTSFLLAGAVKGSFCRRTSAHREALYLLMKRAIKGKVSAENMKALRIRFADASDDLWIDVQALFGTSSRPSVEQLLQCSEASQESHLLSELASRADSLAWHRHPLRYARRFVSDTQRKFMRFVRPTGFFVVVLGPDGSGKSTVAKSIRAQLERAFRRTWHFHWRPGLLPNLARSKTRTSDPTSQAPPEVSKYRGIVSLLRFLYYWVDFVLGYWLIVYPKKAQSTLVIGERYFPDILVHPERYGFSEPLWLMRLAAQCVPSPDLIIVLKDDPEVIFARKPELPPVKIAQQIEAYENETKYWSQSAVIHTDGGVAAVTQRARELILDQCSHRVKHLFVRKPDALRWWAFPSVRNVKVWVSEADELSNALNLYHPYSNAGLLAKVILPTLPQWVYRKIFGTMADPATAHRLLELTRELRTVLSDENLIVSFFAGTPGPHRKTTAQIMRGNEIVGYAKIGHTERVHTLLQQEVEMLRWLEREGFRAAAVPRVLAFVRSGTDLLLLLSPPPNEPGVQRAESVDIDDMRFLLALSTLNIAIFPIDQIIERFKLDEYVRRVSSREAEQLIWQAKQAIEVDLTDTGVRVCACHGDYAPWNTLEINDGRMYVIDWEYGQQHGPVLGDLFHRVISPLRLLEQLPARTVVDRLFEMPSDSKFARLMDLVGVDKSSLASYLLLYLLEQICMRPTYEPYPEPFLLEAVRATLARRGETPRRPKVLVAAYACEPDSGSEPGVGWRMCQAISRDHDVWVVTRRNNQQKIDSALTREPNSHLRFVYTDLPEWARQWKKKERGVRVYYYLWQFAAWRTARRMMKDVAFDFGHHITFVNDYTFSFLGLLRLPFVWGPIGSNMKGPASLMLSTNSVIRDRAQYYFKAILRTVDPLVWFCAARARLIVGNHSSVCRRLPFSMLARGKYRTHIAIGVEERILHQAVDRDRKGFRVISVGDLLPIKQFHLTLRSFAKLASADPHAHLIIVGQGPQKQELQDLAHQLGISARVEFQPLLPRSEALALMANADAFLFPSFEVAGMVVLEALAHGLPVIGLKNTGPGEMITPECGYAIDAGTMNETTDRLADALQALAADPQLRKRMGNAAQHIVRSRYLWEERHRAIRTWYTEAGVVPP